MPHDRPYPYPAESPPWGTGPAAMLPPQAPLPESPPTALYVSRDDRLWLRVRNAVPGVVVSVFARHVEPNGRVQLLRFDLTPASDRSESFATFDLGDGYLLSLAVVASAGAVQRGQCFVQVGLLRDAAAARVLSALLVSDYLASAGALGWPGGLIRSSLDGPGHMIQFTPANPAAGADFTITVPAGARWRVNVGRLIFVTSAAVAARRMVLVLDDGALVYFEQDTFETQPASSSDSYCFTAYGFLAAALVTLHMVPMPPDLVMPAGHRLRSVVQNIQAADQISAIHFLIEEWVEA